MKNEITTTERASNLSIFDSGAFETMGKIAQKLAQSSLIPETLKGKTQEETVANCFRVVEQAQRWGLSPFAVMDGASVIHGKLGWEGKVIAAAVFSVGGVRLRYKYAGEIKSDSREVTVIGTVDGEEKKVVGSVAKWKTSGAGSPWKSGQDNDQQLSYRGAREWARRHMPEVILGVYSRDEIDNEGIRNVTPSTTKALAKISAAENPPEVESSKEADPMPETKPKASRRKKERHTQAVTFLDVTERTSNGKTWWAASVQTKKGSTVEMNTFSTTMSERLSGLFNGDQIEVTFTQTPKGGFALEDFSIIENGEEASNESS